MPTIGNTLYVNVNVYLYGSNRVLKSPLGLKTLIFPYVNPSLNLPTGVLYGSGTATQLLIELGNIIPNFQAVSMQKRTYINSYNTDIFNSIFPNIDINEIGDNDFMVLENAKTKKVCSSSLTSGNVYYYNSRDDFESDTGAVNSYWAEPFILNIAGGSGNSRGNTKLLFYTDLTDNYISNFKLAEIRGVSSTGGTLTLYSWSNPSASINEFVSFLGEPSDVKILPDPFTPGGEAEPGGGTGDFDGTSDAIPIPDLPQLSATSTGFITLFNPTSAQLRALANYMWSNSLFDLDTWKKIFADPMDAILGLSIVPVAVPSGGSSPVSVGNIATDVSMTTAAAQYVAVDCGTLNVNEYWGAYLDYEPFTKAEIYLPYIGTHAISVDDIMGKAVHVVYHVDILSGACAAYVQCGESVLYTFIGQCASSIPITGNDWTNVINGVLSAAASIGSMVATGGASAPLAVPALASTAVNGMKPSIEKSGSLAGTGGMLGVQTPYIILTRPRQCLPSNQNSYMGYPSFIGASLGDLSGYAEIESVHLDGITATDSEISEIETLLKGGVIF